MLDRANKTKKGLARCGERMRGGEIEEENEWRDMKKCHIHISHVLIMCLRLTEPAIFKFGGKHTHTSYAVKQSPKNARKFM